MIFKQFTEEIKEKREKLEIKQTDLASMLNISVSTYNRIEKGKTEPTFSTIILLSLILSIDLNKYVQKEKSKKKYIFFD